MQTDTIFAYRLDEGDNLVRDDEVVGVVIDITDDENDTIIVTVTDDYGEHARYEYGPFETAVIVVSFEDD